MGKLDHVDPFLMVTNLLWQGRDIVEKWARVLVMKQHDVDLGLREQVTLILAHALFEQAEAAQDHLSRVRALPNQPPTLSVFTDCLECYVNTLIRLLSVFTEDESAYIQRKRNHSVHGHFTAYYIDTGPVLFVQDGGVVRNIRYNYRESLLTKPLGDIGFSVRAKMIFTASSFWPLLLEGFTQNWLTQAYNDLARAQKQMQNAEPLSVPGFVFMPTESCIIGPALVGELAQKALVEYRDSLGSMHDPLIEQVLSGKIDVIDGKVFSKTSN